MISDLQIRAERYALAIEGTNDGLWDWDFKNNTVFYSNRWKAMLGYKDPKAIGDSPNEWIERLHPDDREKFQFSLKTYLQERTHHFKAEYRIRHAHGHYLWMLCRGHAVWDKAGEPIRFVGFQTDISKNKDRENRLFHDAFHDPLTGLFNRALFMDHLNQALYGRTLFAILYMDMDYFKQINDLLGHKAGDELLIRVAKRLETCCRLGDTLARFGGDEFTLLLNDIKNIHEVEKIAHRILEVISDPFIIDGQKIHGSITIGIALKNPSKDRYPEDVIRNADIALYQGKERKKGGYQVFDERMRRRAISHNRLAAELSRNMKENKIVYYYHPIIALESGKTVGLQALLRWEHEEYGVLKPLEFLDLATERQLIVKLERIALSLMPKQVEILHPRLKNEGFFMFFNISLQQLSEHNFLKYLKRILDKYSFPASSICLEFTENVLVNAIDPIEEIFISLKALGFKLCLSGYGAGYSSLSFLHYYPVDFVKIDYSVVLKIEEEPKKAIFVKNLIKIAKLLKIGIIAEGVETETILKHLQAFHCPYAQGFYFSPPQPFNKLVDFL